MIVSVYLFINLYVVLMVKPMVIHVNWVVLKFKKLMMENVKKSLHVYVQENINQYVQLNNRHLVIYVN